MLKILGEHYYLDLDKIESFKKAAPVEKFTGVSENHIIVVKYETDYNKNIKTSHSIKSLKELEDKLKEIISC